MLFTWVINLAKKKRQVEVSESCVFYIYTPNLLIGYTPTYTPTIFLSFFKIFDTVYTYLSVHRSLGNHGPNKLCLEILPDGRSFLRHSVLHFLLLCTSIQPHVTQFRHEEMDGLQELYFYIEVLLTHYAGILEMNVEKYSLTTPTRLPRPRVRRGQLSCMFQKN